MIYNLKNTGIVENVNKFLKSAYIIQDYIMDQNARIRRCTRYWSPGENICQIPLL